MNSVERVKKICKERKIAISKLERDLGYANGYVGQLRKGVFPADRLQEIANYLDVTAEYLLTGENVNGLTTCTECGLSYDSLNPHDVKMHKRQHEAFEKAEKKFGVIYGYYPERERVKAENRNIYENSSLSLEQRYNAQLEVLRCLFSRSLEASMYSLNHVDFDTYVAMMLENNSYGPKLDNNIFVMLKNKFGTLPGIDKGTYYHVPLDQPQTIAAHFDGSEYTEEQLDRIKAFAAFIKAEDNKKNK